MLCSVAKSLDHEVPPVLAIGLGFGLGLGSELGLGLGFPYEVPPVFAMC